MALAALLVLASACAGSRPPPLDFAIYETSAEESHPLGGDALAQRKHELRRAHRDMSHFLATLEGLRFRDDRNGTVLFRRFVDAYMGLHLDHLLRHEWQSRHAEVSGLDATLRLAKADVLIHMKATRRMQQTLNELEERYAGRESMLVEYPLGTRSSLKKAVELVRQRKWRG